MFKNLQLFQTASALAGHAGKAQAQVTMNIANADTPGYRPAHLRSFSDSYRHSATSLRQTRGGHQGAQNSSTHSSLMTRSADIAPNGNGVSLEEEMVAAVGAKKSHDRAIAIYRHGMTILRSSMGRR